MRTGLICACVLVLAGAIGFTGVATWRNRERPQTLEEKVSALEERCKALEWEAGMSARAWRGHEVVMKEHAGAIRALLQAAQKAAPKEVVTDEK